jgi:hypothetical protein
MSSIIWIEHYTNKFKNLVAMICDVFFSSYIIILFLFMRYSVYFYDYLVFQAREIYYIVSQCFLSSKIVWRSFEYHPHSYFREIHTLLILI